MCGIYGIHNLKVSKQAFTHELNKMAHRGPDGWGVWQSGDEVTMLGHQRLAIIDTDPRSNQPMCFDDRFVIVYNGEIYNYVELRKELLKEGVKFSTGSDTEVLLKLWIAKGPDALPLLNGMWSFVIYDKLEKSFFMSRDRLGKKPLYYIRKGSSFAFSSEFKNLLCYLDEIIYDRDFISFSVKHQFQSEAAEKTIFHGIKKFPAGSYGVFRNGDLFISRYYYPEDLLQQQNPYRTFLRMRSDVPVGSSLSGGIDSSFLVSTLGCLQRDDGKAYKALVCSFPASSLDETAAALLTAKNAGVEAEAIVVNPNLDPNSILRVVYQFEEISGTAPVPFLQLYKAFRDRNIVVSLDGHGADELFGGYSFDLYSKLSDDFPDLLKMRRTLDTIDKMYGFENNITMNKAWPYFKGELLRKIKERNWLSAFEKEQYYKATLLQSTFYNILPTLLRNYDKYSMSSGIEIRMPFLDHRILEFAFTLPNKYRFRNGFTKAIVRNAAKGIVPDQILSNKVKKGWNSPMHEWFAGPWKEWLFDEVQSLSFTTCDLVDHKSVHALVRNFERNSHPDLNTGQQLWLQLQPYLIEKAFKVFNKVEWARTLAVE
jgi:asparagine synthase (glutamine-hydrolysing)